MKEKYQLLMNDNSVIETVGNKIYHSKGLGFDGLAFKVEMNVEFEGYYGRASEDNEYQWVVTIGDIVVKSKRFETVDSVILRAFDEYQRT